MKILIVNGSPKGKYSVTLQTLNYLALRFPEHDFSVIHAGQQIKKIQRDFSSSKKALEEADLIVFSYPVYTFIAPCQLHYFIDLMKENTKDKIRRKANIVTTFIKFAILLLIIAGIPLYVYFCHPEVIEYMSSLDNIYFSAFSL